MRAWTSLALTLLIPSLVVVAVRADDGPPVSWRGAGDGRYSKGRSRSIDRIVIHTVEGSQESAVNTFKSGPRKVSAHYIVGDDGSIVQCVKDEDTAFHCRGWNSRSIGIEHAGFADEKATWTRVKYEASARLTRSLCDRYSIPKDREHIVGHVEVPGATHHDPGEHFDWDLYMKLVRGDEEAGGIAPETSGSTALDQLPLPQVLARRASREKQASEAQRVEAGQAKRVGEAGEAKSAATGGVTGRLARAAGAP